jgi:hypothetical protein
MGDKKFVSTKNKNITYARKYAVIALILTAMVSISAGMKSSNLTGPNFFGNVARGLALGLLGIPILGIFTILPAFAVGRYIDYRKRDEISKARDDEAFKSIGAEGFNELMYHAGKGDSLKIKALLEQGSLDVNARDDKGATALVYAVMNNQLATASLLLRQGASAIIATNKGLTPQKIAENNNLSEMK